MDSSTVGAIISALASIIVAVIGLKQQSNERTQAPRNSSPTSSRAVVEFPRLTHVWPWAAALLSATALLVTFFIHHDLGVFVMFIAPVVFSLLAFFRPIRPLWAAAISLVPFPFAFLSKSLWQAYHGIQEPFRGFNISGIWLTLGIAVITALSSAAISRWKQQWITTEPLPGGTLAKPIREGSATNSTDEIDKLWKLHSAGALTVDEFNEAKKRVLSSINDNR